MTPNYDLIILRSLRDRSRFTLQRPYGEDVMELDAAAAMQFIRDLRRSYPDARIYASYTVQLELHMDEVAA